MSTVTQALIARTLEELGISTSYCADRGLPVFEEATDLVSVGLDVAGREQRLQPAAATAWHRMRAEAESDGVTLLLVSAFRSFEQQRGIVARKLAAGQTLERILAVNAPPGYSQHHSGKAVDLATPGCALLSEDFERTDAFIWLHQHAASYGFSLTYPRENSYGIAYEPWHWAFLSHTMSTSNADKVFSGSIPKIYEMCLVPLIFEPYAADLVHRLTSKPLTRVLEIAAGTGVVTRALASVLPERVSIVATDLNQSMLDQASALGTKRPVEWRQADGMQLPFQAGTFDAVVCQFGVMFFPDKSKAFSEARRVLRPGGVFIFNVWDHIRENEFADTVTTALESLFPEDPPRFLARIPHGYYNRPTIERDLKSGGFTASPRVATIVARSRAESSQVPAIAYCQGTPLRNEIEARDASRLGEATDTAAEAIARRFGHDAVDGKIQAHIVTIES